MLRETTREAERIDAAATAIEKDVARLFADPKERHIECLRASTQILHDAMRMIAAGELTRGKTVEVARLALDRETPYRIAVSRLSRTPKGPLP